MLCMPFEKLPLWLATINPNKIPDLAIREKVERYQAESAIVLYEYWTKGGSAATDRRIDGRAAALTMREAEPAMRHGGARAKGEQDADGHLETRGTNKAETIASRLKRDHPDIAAAVERGEFASMRDLNA